MKKRIPLNSYRPLSPSIVNNFIDSCAFDPNENYDEAAASDEIFHLYKEGKFQLLITHSVQKEIDHPNTPSWVKLEASNMIYTLDTDITDQERVLQTKILDILAGNGKREKMQSDALHISIASKHGGYFITTDNRILKKAPDLHKICQTTIFKPTEFLNVYKNI